MDYEIVVVHDREADGAYLEDLRRLAGERLIVVEVPGLFNFSRKINRGVEASTGDVIVMLNDDIAGDHGPMARAARRHCAAGGRGGCGCQVAAMPMGHCNTVDCGMRVA